MPFSGVFNGRNYRSPIPPRTQFRNHALSPAHESFVSTEIQRELRIGAIRRWGNVGSVKPPHLVLPVGVEPSKPRKLNDGRFLNLWCTDSPFEFEGLHMLSALVDKGSTGTTSTTLADTFMSTGQRVAKSSVRLRVARCVLCVHNS